MVPNIGGWSLILVAVLLPGCGTAGHVLGLALEASRPLLRAVNVPGSSNCATDLERRPDGSWWRCGKLESPAPALETREEEE